MSVTDEWIEKVWYLCTMEYYSATKRNAWDSVRIRWVNLEPIVQSEVSQKKENNILAQYIWDLERWNW